MEGSPWPTAAALVGFLDRLGRTAPDFIGPLRAIWNAANTRFLLQLLSSDV